MTTSVPRLISSVYPSSLIGTVKSPWSGPNGKKFRGICIPPPLSFAVEKNKTIMQHLSRAHKTSVSQKASYNKLPKILTVQKQVRTHMEQIYWPHSSRFLGLQGLADLQ